jgi:hypothetical protein
MNHCQINDISIKNWNNKIIEIQIIISIVRVSEHVNYTLIDLHYVLSNRQPNKKRLMFLPGYGPIAIADWSIIVQCHLLVKHGF